MRTPNCPPGRLASLRTSALQNIMSPRLSRECALQACVSFCSVNRCWLLPVMASELVVNYPIWLCYGRIYKSCSENSTLWINDFSSASVLQRLCTRVSNKHKRALVATVCLQQSGFSFINNTFPSRVPHKKIRSKGLAATGVKPDSLEFLFLGNKGSY